MSPEELREYLRHLLDKPGELIARLWLLWWIWSSIRGALKKRSEQQKPPGTEPETARPTPAPAPAPAPRAPKAEKAPRPARAQRPAPVETSARGRMAAPVRARADERFVQGLAAAEALSLRVAGDRGLDYLAPIVADEVIEPLRAAIDRGKRPGSPEGHDGERAEQALLLLGVIERSVAQRMGAEGLQLRALDAVADGAHAPLREYAKAEGLALRGMRPLVTSFDPALSRLSRGASALLLLPTPSGAGTRLSDYAELFAALGRSWYFALPGFAEHAARTLDLPPRARVPDARRGYTEQTVQACLGPFLPTLFADTAMTLRLGAGYAAGLCELVSRDPQPTRVRAEQGFVSMEPPAVLRLHAALHTLSVLGQHAAGEQLRARFAQRHGDTAQAYLPLSDGQHLTIATDYLLDLTTQVAQFFLETRASGLRGVPMVEWSGVTQTLEDAHEQARLAAMFARWATPGPTTPVQLASAALLATGRGADPSRALTLLQLLLGRRGAADAQIMAAPSSRAVLPLRAALRDARTLRSAIVLGAVLTKRRGMALRARP